MDDILFEFEAIADKWEQAGLLVVVATTISVSMSLAAPRKEKSNYKSRDWLRCVPLLFVF